MRNDEVNVNVSLGGEAWPGKAMAPEPAHAGELTGSGEQEYFEELIETAPRDGMPEDADCLSDQVPPGTKSPSGAKKIHLPELVSMWKYMLNSNYANRRLSLYSFLNRCLRQGSLSRIVGFRVLNRVINREACELKGVTFWKIDRENFYADVEVELKLQSTNGIRIWNGYLVCWCAFDENEFTMSVEDLTDKLDRRSEGLVIITKSISRFARNTVDTLQTVRELQGYGVQVYFEKEGIDTADSLSEMVLTIMASFAQEESRSISENVKWGIRKRFEAGHEVKVPLYGFYHTDDELFLIQEDEAAIVREVFERFVHGEAPAVIMDDMIARGVKPPAGKCWKRLQIDRMIKNEKYAGDVVLQKTYIENHLTHKQIRNHGDLPKFRVENAHEAIVDRHIFEQAQKIMAMRNVAVGNSTYPYGEMLRCPHCGKPLVHGSLNNFY